ncbi:MAG: hypothetical protein ABIF22_01875, partial [bacterium]
KRDESSDTDKFGFRSECRGRETLGEFFKKNGMIVTTSKMKFIDWCKELNEVSKKYVGSIPDLVEVTGEDAWYDLWKDGFSPEDAYIEDITAGE